MTSSLILTPIGKTCLIKEINTDHVTKERLESLGFIKGVEITTMRKSPLDGIRIYKCLNTLTALRNDIADKILVETDHE
jgi:Fe2+ transport system protein FeoA